VAGGQRAYIRALPGLCGERRGLSLGLMRDGILGGDWRRLLLSLSLSGRTPAEQSSKLPFSYTNSRVMASELHERHTVD
jgi:hypothetical protein